eukprot:COSAG06_NODE_4349_length_4348_cov_1.211815_2_plen_180_part_00
MPPPRQACLPCSRTASAPSNAKVRRSAAEARVDGSLTGAPFELLRWSGVVVVERVVVWNVAASIKQCTLPASPPATALVLSLCPCWIYDIPGGGPGGHFSLFDSLEPPVARGDRSRLGSEVDPRSTPSAVGRAVLVSHLRVRQLGRRRRRCTIEAGEPVAEHAVQGRGRRGGPHRSCSS